MYQYIYESLSFAKIIDTCAIHTAHIFFFTFERYIFQCIQNRYLNNFACILTNIKLVLPQAYLR